MPTVPKIPLAKNDRWLEVTEVAALFGVDAETVNRWCRDGKLKSYMPARRRYLKKSDVNEVLESKGLPTI